MHDKIGILFMVEALHPGGAEGQLFLLLQGLNKDLFKPYLITWVDDNFYGKEEDINFEWVKVKRKFKFDPYPILTAVSLVKRKKIQIIQGFLDSGNLYAFIVKTLCSNTHFVASERSSERKLTALQKIHKPLSHKSADVTITNSSKGLEFINKLTKNNAKKAICIRNSVDIQRFAPVKSNEKQQLRQYLHIPTGKKIFLNVSRITFLKNQLGILQSFLKVEEEFRLLMIGKADTDYLSILEAFIENEGLSNKVIILPPQNNIEKWYQAADCFILNSDYEGTPNVILEAFSCKLPVIATDVGDINHYVNDQNGWLIPPQNHLALQEKIKMFFQVPENKLTEMGENGRSQLIKLGATTKQMIKQYEVTYQSIINS